MLDFSLFRKTDAASAQALKDAAQPLSDWYKPNQGMNQMRIIPGQEGRPVIYSTMQHSVRANLPDGTQAYRSHICLNWLRRNAARLGVPAAAIPAGECPSCEAVSQARQMPGCGYDGRALDGMEAEEQHIVLVLPRMVADKPWFAQWYNLPGVVAKGVFTSAQLASGQMVTPGQINMAAILVGIDALTDPATGRDLAFTVTGEGKKRRYDGVQFVQTPTPLVQTQEHYNQLVERLVELGKKSVYEVGAPIDIVSSLFEAKLGHIYQITGVAQRVQQQSGRMLGGATGLPTGNYSLPASMQQTAQPMQMVTQTPQQSSFGGQAAATFGGASQAAPAATFGSSFGGQPAPASSGGVDYKTELPGE